MAPVGPGRRKERAKLLPLKESRFFSYFPSGNQKPEPCPDKLERAQLLKEHCLISKYLYHWDRRFSFSLIFTLGNEKEDGVDVLMLRDVNDSV